MYRTECDELDPLVNGDVPKNSAAIARLKVIIDRLRAGDGRVVVYRVVVKGIGGAAFRRRWFRRTLSPHGFFTTRFVAGETAEWASERFVRLVRTRSSTQCPSIRGSSPWSSSRSGTGRRQRQSEVSHSSIRPRTRVQTTAR